MPIRRDEWLLGRKVKSIFKSQIYIELLSITMKFSNVKWYSILSKVEEFLRKNHDYAYNFREIEEILVKEEGDKRTLGNILLRLALDQLINDEVIEAREIMSKNGTRKIYFAYKSPRNQ